MSSIVLYGMGPEPTDPRVDPWRIIPNVTRLQPFVTTTNVGPDPLAEEGLPTLVPRLRKRLAQLDELIARADVARAEADVIRKMLAMHDATAAAQEPTK